MGGPKMARYDKLGQNHKAYALSLYQRRRFVVHSFQTNSKMNKHRGAHGMLGIAGMMVLERVLLVFL